MQVKTPAGAWTQRAMDGEPQVASAEVVPSKRDLTSWWKTFKWNNKKEEEKAVEVQSPTGIFGVPLAISIRYANVAISLADTEGIISIYGYVPIIVAKCGVYLKERATEIEGIFRLAGAERRVKELQATFSSPDKYGKGLDWTGYTVHDAANVLRRYLNQLPEPIVPLEFYDKFREPLRQHQAQVFGEQPQDDTENIDLDVAAAITTYQHLITELPAINRQMLLYLLDLLAVFAAKADVNLMTPQNLAAIFQPGLIRHPAHDMAPAEYRLSQVVLVFLINQQDHFLVGMKGTAADEQTIQDVQSGSPSPQRLSSGPTTPKSRAQQLIGRSASTASTGSDSARRFSALRRNVSVSSKNSRQSNYAASPITPPLGSPFVPIGKGIVVHRSNTLPSKKSPGPALQPERLPRGRGDQQAPSPAAPNILARNSPHSSRSATPAPALASVSEVEPPKKLALPPSPPVVLPSHSPQLRPTTADYGRASSHERKKSIEFDLSVGAEGGRSSPSNKPARERTFGNLFKQSPAQEAEKKEKKSNRLQKKRAPDVVVTQKSSSHSLSGGSYPNSPAFPPQTTTSRRGSHNPSEGHIPDSLGRNGIAPTATGDNLMQHTLGRPVENYVTARSSPVIVPYDHVHTNSAGSTLKPIQSPAGSLTSSGSSCEPMDQAEVTVKKEKKHRWRKSMTVKKEQALGNGTPTAMGTAHGAERSTSTVGSMSKSRKSMTDGSYQSTEASGMPPSSNGAELLGSSQPGEKKGAFGWFKDKLGRAKSPARNVGGGEFAKSKQSVNAMASGSETGGRSVEKLGMGIADASGKDASA